MDFEGRFRLLLSCFWKFILENRDKCLSFLRYYYSPYFKLYSYEEHHRRYQCVVDEIAPLFREKCDVWMVFNYVLNTMLDFAVKVFNGDVADDDATADRIFEIVYSSVRPFLPRIA